MITEFQTQFLLKNKLTLSCDDIESLKILKDVYMSGKYHLFDPKLANTMIKYGEAYEYVYLDDKGNIQVNCLMVLIHTLYMMMLVI